MVYVGLYKSYAAISIGMVLLGVIGITIGLVLMFNSESSDTEVKNGLTLLVCSVSIGVLGAILSAKLRYEIKVDKSVTVEELTDTFVVCSYDQSNDIWIVYQKKAGLDPRDLENSKDES